MSDDPQGKRIEWGSTTISGPRHHYRERTMVKMLVRRLSPPGFVVDAGCGGGSLTLRLLGEGYRVCAFDPAFEFVRHLDSLIPGTGRERVILFSGSAEEIPLKSAHADALTCGEVLEHLDRDRAAVREFHRVLKPGGICVTTVPAGTRLWDEIDEWAGHRRRYDRGELESLFSTAGFSIRTVRSLGFPLMRLYHRWLFAPWARRAMKTDSLADHRTLLTRFGKSGAISRMLGTLFSLDGMFSRLPWGIGTLLVAEKR